MSQKIHVDRAILEEMYVKNNESIKTIAYKLGISATTIGRLVKKYEFPTNKYGHWGSLVGRQFNRLTVIEKAEPTPCGNVRWKCICDCGKECIIPGAGLCSGSTKSCGCYKTERARRGYGDLSGTYWSKIKEGAGTRGHPPIEITPQDAWEVFLKQDRKCALTGLPIKLVPNYDKSIEQTASLDRIDSSKNYTKDNIQWIHKIVNVMKNKYRENDFIYLCRLIAEHTKDRNLILPDLSQYGHYNKNTRK